MYDHLIEEMADALVAAKLVTDRDAAIAVLGTVWQDKIAITWNTDDVRIAADNIGRTITEEECGDVLQRVLGDLDARVGVNWDTIEAALPSDLSAKKKRRK